MAKKATTKTPCSAVPVSREEWKRRRLHDLAEGIVSQLAQWPFKSRRDALPVAEWADELAAMINDMEDEEFERSK